MPIIDLAENERFAGRAMLGFEQMLLGEQTRTAV
jgi:hypothetical protein